MSIFYMMMALVFLIGGYLFLRLHQNRIREKERLEDALKFLYSSFSDKESITAQSLAGKLEISLKKTTGLLQEMTEKGLVHLQQGKVELTHPGKALGLHLLRAHRLWERYLSDYTDVPLSELHGRAEKMEHALSREDLGYLEAALGYPKRDPHGDPIPDKEGVILGEKGTPLTDWATGKVARVVHIEDEPESLLMEILEKDILPGTVLFIQEKTPQGLLLRVEGREDYLPLMAASNLYVVPFAVREEALPPFMPLSSLIKGQKARIVALSKELRGLMRRRLLDLGFTRGARVEVNFPSSFGKESPSAYRIRGTLIALRKGESDKIYVELEEENR